MDVATRISVPQIFFFSFSLHIFNAFSIFHIKIAIVIVVAAAA